MSDSFLNDLTETRIDSTPIHTGPVIHLTHDTVRLPNGETALREVAWHPGGVVILPVLDSGQILLVEQFRYAVGHTLLELPAGKLNPGEDPLKAAQRELLEETGYEATDWQALGFIYTAPGFCNERLYLFRAEGLVAHPNPPKEEDEFITLHTLEAAELRQRVMTQQISDAKTLSLLHYL
jgi:ADP-ribose pyrophosphatase